ncbi:MAG: ATPase [Proteobacteria bacterium]|nr:ATPase [Pseudomonadota bacterium]
MHSPRLIQTGQMPSSQTSRLTSSPILKIAMAVLCTFAQPGHSAVTAVSETGFVSEHSLTVSVAPLVVYQALVDHISEWWDSAHTYTGDARNLSIDAQGCFCEALPEGGRVEHMRVVYAAPGKLLRLTGGLGPLQALAVSGSMEFVLQADGAGTIVKYRYIVGGYTPEGLTDWAGPIDAVQTGQLERLKAYLERG